MRFWWFSSVPPEECRDSTLTLGHDRFLPNSFQFTIHVSSTLYSLVTEKHRKINYQPTNHKTRNLPRPMFIVFLRMSRTLRVTHYRFLVPLNYTIRIIGLLFNENENEGIKTIVTDKLTFVYKVFTSLRSVTWVYRQLQASNFTDHAG
jgi:hypothetical protein